MGDTKKQALPLETPGLNIEAWDDYVQHRRDIRAPRLRGRGEIKQREWLAQYDHETQARIVDETMRNGWQGIFEPKGTNGAAKAGNKADEWWDRLVDLARRGGNTAKLADHGIPPDVIAAVQRMGGWSRICMATADQLRWRRKDFVAEYANG